MVVIRAASTADAPRIAAVMRDSWFAAYEGIIAYQIIDRVTAPDGGVRVRQSFGTRPWQRMIAAVARHPRPAAAAAQAAQAAQAAVAAEAAGAPGIVGYASFGPELDVLGMSWPYPRTVAGAEGRVAELYALYVRPAWWSTGTGRALMDHVLARVSVAGYGCITLWVLEGNARARRFYERAGFAPDGASHGLPDLGVTEIRYRRALGVSPGASWQSGSRRITTMAHDDGAAEAAGTYFQAWQARDFARLRAVLADDVDFAGPLGQVTGADECLRSLEGLSRILTGIEVRKVFANGPDVLTWYDMATSVAEPVPVANWMQVRDGKITRIRVAFDPRGIAGGS